MQPCLLFFLSMQASPWLSVSAQRELTPNPSPSYFQLSQHLPPPSPLSLNMSTLSVSPSGHQSPLTASPSQGALNSINHPLTPQQSQQQQLFQYNVYHAPHSPMNNVQSGTNHSNSPNGAAGSPMARPLSSGGGYSDMREAALFTPGGLHSLQSPVERRSSHQSEQIPFIHRHDSLGDDLDNDGGSPEEDSEDGVPLRGHDMELDDTKDDIQKISSRGPKGLGGSSAGPSGGSLKTATTNNFVAKLFMYVHRSRPG